jgi:RsiW-degrading membrane proteinase PrsW (M82 family)
MLEASFRKIHRTFGIYLVGFLALQAFTGLLIALGTLASTSRDTWWFWLAAGLHHDWNPVGSIYRVLLGIFTLAQAMGGVVIYRLIRARERKS